VFVELVGDGIHRSSRGVDVNISQPEQSLQRTLLNP
jgi:hypothetical protein